MPTLDRPLVPADFGRALARGDIDIALQPLVNLRSGRVVRLEALARWEHDLRGQVAPATFIPLAEAGGEATALAFQMLRRSSAYLPRWRTRLGELRVAVNICVQTFQDPLFVDRLAAFLERDGAAAEWFELEITESTFMQEPERTLQAVEDVRRLGFVVAIDDFGTGYSSLGYLATLPVNAVKIDRQFVIPMTTDHRREAIVRATIALGHDLGFEVVAEGVEDRDTWELLGALGCDVAQGYHIARPMPAGEVQGWLESWDPATAAIGHPKIDPRRRAGGPRGSATRHVLVADDEPAIVEMIRDILEDSGFRVVTASNGSEALRLVEEAEPQVVLLDMNMPVLDGEGFIAAVRERGLRIPIVVMTAGSSAKRWAAQLGADAYLSKPFELASLVDVTTRFAATDNG
ncbi:MAG TPA: EAL domain-containing protein [Candidatus Limnocylindria bacterium]|nr:EAL domain-containing protein [Candidatus Limnocylindria bacterium]